MIAIVQTAKAALETAEINAVEHPGGRGALAKALFGIGLLLPLLGGGNVMFLLEPEQAMLWLLFASLGFVWLAFATPLGPHTAIPAVPSASLLVLVGWWCGTLLLRAFGPRAVVETQGILTGALLFAAFARRSFSERELIPFARGLVLGTLITAVYAQYQYWVMYPTVAPLFRETFGMDPISSINANFYNANCYAPFLAATTLLTVGLVTNRSPGGTRAGALLALVALLVTLCLTGSRATLVLLGAAALFVVASGNDRSVRAVAVIAVLTAAILSAVWMTSAWIFEGLWSVAARGRFDIWRGAWSMIADHWTVGVGLGKFADSFIQYRVTDYYTRYPHNVLLEVFAETGVIGFLALLTFLLTGVAGLLRSLRDDRSGLRASVVATAVLLIAHSMVDIDWHAPANPILLMILLGASRTSRRDVPL